MFTFLGKCGCLRSRRYITEDEGNGGAAYLLLAVLVIGIAIGVWIGRRFTTSVGKVAAACPPSSVAAACPPSSDASTQTMPVDTEFLEKVFVTPSGDCFHDFGCYIIREAGRMRTGTRGLRRCKTCLGQLGS